MVDKGSLNCEDIDNDPFDVLYVVLNLNIAVTVSLYFFFQVTKDDFTIFASWKSVLVALLRIFSVWIYSWFQLSNGSLFFLTVFGHNVQRIDEIADFFLVQCYYFPQLFYLCIIKSALLQHGLTKPLLIWLVNFLFISFRLERFLNRWLFIIHFFEFTYVSLRFYLPWLSFFTRTRSACC